MKRRWLEGEMVEGKKMPVLWLRLRRLRDTQAETKIRDCEEQV